MKTSDYRTAYARRKFKRELIRALGSTEGIFVCITFTGFLAIGLGCLAAVLFP